VRAGTLTDGVRSWLVVDWDAVPAYGGGAGSANSAQVWIQLGETEGVSLAHGALSGPSVDGLTVGAENRDGTSGVQLAGPPTPGPGYVVRTAPPRPGGAATLAYTATPRTAGQHELVATARADTVRGETRVVTRLTATR